MAGKPHALEYLFGLKKPAGLNTLAFEEKEAYEQGFSAYYAHHIRPLAERYETARLQAIRKMRRHFWMSAPAGSVATTLQGMHWYHHPTHWLYQGDNNAFITLLIASVLLVLVSTWYPVRQYKQKVKDEVYPHIIGFFQGFTYKQEPDISARDLKPFKILPNFNNEHREDHIKGTYKEVMLESLEVQLTTGKGKDRTIVFDGLCILFSASKRFQGMTVVRKDKGMLGNWFKKLVGSMERVRLEDPVFEEKFEVYSTDQIEARYLLTTSFMQRLLDLAELFNASVQCSFFENRLFIMLPTKKNMFETASIHEPANFIEDSRILLKEMHLLFQIIDILKLDQKTGL